MSKKEIFNHIFNASISDKADEIYIYDPYECGAVARMCFRFFSGNDELQIKAFLVPEKPEDSCFEGIPVIVCDTLDKTDIPILIATFNKEWISSIKSKLYERFPNAELMELELKSGAYNLEQDEWKQFFEQFDIYNRLMDEESKMIFRYKAAYDTFGRDWRYIRELLRKTKAKDSYEDNTYINLLEFIKKSSEDENIRFVLAGEYSELIVERISELGYPVEAYLGNGEEKRIPTIKKEDLFQDYSGHYILVKDFGGGLGTLEQLLNTQIPKERLVLACNCGCGMEYEHPMYFEKIFKPSTDGIFIDGGCFTGSTIDDFIKWNGNYKKVYSFEPEFAQYERCKEKFAHDEKVEILNNAVWNKRERLHFVNNGAGSHVSDDSLICVEGISVDEVVGDEKVTFLKYDIEGSELKGLEGAKETIIRNKPDLAICVYHKADDLYTIPNYILSLCPEYKIYLRHYQLSRYETVLLATCKL